MFLKKPVKTLIALCLMVVPALLLAAPDAVDLRLNRRLEQAVLVALGIV